MSKKNNTYWYLTFSVVVIILIATIVAFEYGEALGKVIAEHNEDF